MTLTTLAQYFMAAAGIPLAVLTLWAWAYPEKRAPKTTLDKRN